MVSGAMFAKVLLAARDKTSILERGLTLDEIDAIVTEVSGWDISIDAEAENHAEAFEAVLYYGAHSKEKKTCE